MYIITGKLNGGYEIEGELKEVSKTYKTRFRFIANILVFYCKCFNESGNAIAHVKEIPQ